jgi:hypothetical protein
MPRIGKSMETESKLVDVREIAGGENREWMLLGVGLLSGVMEKTVLESDSDNVCTTLWIYKKTLNCLLENI